MQNMQPWYRGFTGTIKPSGEKGSLEQTVDGANLTLRYFENITKAVWDSRID